MKKGTLCSLIFLSFFLMASAGFADQEVCGSFVPAAVGGPISNNDSVLSIRWLGASNLELTYRGQVILFSAYFGRGPDFPPLVFPQPVVRADGFLNAIIEPEQVVRADAVFLGHAHGDHMQDAAQVALQTGATVFGPSTAVPPLLAQGLPSKQIVEVHNGDVFQFNGFTVEAALILHSGVGFVQTPPDVLDAYSAYHDELSALSPPPSAAQTAWRAAQRGKSGGQPPVYTYLFTFGHDFRVILYDSANPNLTPEVKALIAKVGGSTDVCSVAYAGGPEQYSIPNAVMPFIQLCNGKFFISNHHDGRYNMNLIPLFDAIRDEVPGTTPVFLFHKQAACFNVKSHKIIP